MAAELTQLFGSDSEDDQKGSGDEMQASPNAQSGSTASSDSSSSEKGSTVSSRAESPAAGSGPASPSGSNSSSSLSSSSSSSSGSDSAPSSPGSADSPAGSAPASPAGSTHDSPAGSTHDSGSADGLTEDTPVVASHSKVDSDSDNEIGVNRNRQRLPSDSGSDPDAVRATAEDIFGEADDISDEEHAQAKTQEEEEKEEEIPETRIEVEIPRVLADLGESLSFVKLPNFLSVETRPFDPATYEDEIDEDEIMDEEGRARLKLKVENTVRWRNVKDAETGLDLKDEFGEVVRESNAHIVKWSDGTMSLYLGTEIFDIYSMPMQDHTHLYIRQGTGLQGQAMFKNKLSFRPHSTDSFTHRKMTMSLADRSSKSQKIKVLPIAGLDPELSKSENIKKEEERLRASIKRENQQRRTRERAHARNVMTSSYLEGGMDDDEGAISISAIKNKYKKTKDRQREDYSDSEENEYESDGEDLRQRKLQKSKKLVDSDDEVSADSDDETRAKKARVITDSEDSS